MKKIAILQSNYIPWKGYFDIIKQVDDCLLYTSDAADERSSVDLGGRRLIKKKKTEDINERRVTLNITTGKQTIEKQQPQYNTDGKKRTTQ